MDQKGDNVGHGIKRIPLVMNSILKYEIWIWLLQFR